MIIIKKKEHKVINQQGKEEDEALMSRPACRFVETNARGSDHLQQ